MFLFVFWKEDCVLELYQCGEFQNNLKYFMTDFQQTFYFSLNEKFLGFTGCVWRSGLWELGLEVVGK